MVVDSKAKTGAKREGRAGVGWRKTTLGGGGPDTELERVLQADKRYFSC